MDIRCCDIPRVSGAQLLIYMFDGRDSLLWRTVRLFFMNKFDDSPKEAPPTLAWLFHVDCMDYVWLCLNYLHLSRPVYETAPYDRPSINKGTITIYRVSISLVTSVFGMTKAGLTYAGYSTSANWIDWAFGVVTTTM